MMVCMCSCVIIIHNLFLLIIINHTKTDKTGRQRKQKKRRRIERKTNEQIKRKQIKTIAEMLQQQQHLYESQ